MGTQLVLSRQPVARLWIHALLILALMSGSLVFRVPHAAAGGVLQTIGDFLSLGANTVREVNKAIQTAGAEARATLQELKDQLDSLIKTLSDAYQDNLNITLNSLDAVTRNKLLEVSALIDQVNQKIQDDITLASQEAQNVIRQASQQIRQDTAFLAENLKDVIIVGGETAAFVIDRTFYNVVLVISLIALAIGLLLFVRLLFSGKLPQGGLSRVLVLLFMAAFLAIFGSLVLVPSVRAYAMTNLGLGLKQKLDKTTNQPRIVNVIPEAVTIGQTSELELWGTTLLPEGKRPTAKIGTLTVPVKAASNDEIVLDVTGLGALNGGSFDVVLSYDGGTEVRSVVRLIRLTPTPPPADLALTSFSLSPASPQQRDNVTASITLSNQGGSTGAFFLEWRPSAVDTATAVKIRVTGMQAGETKTFTLNTAYPNPGTFSSVAIVDSANEVAESNEANNSLTRSITVRAIPTVTPVPPSTRFSVTVTTGDVFAAGTDANVFITLTGDLGSSNETQLDTDNFDDFERNSTTTYTVTTSRNIGRVTRIRIRHDNSGLFAGWFLERVVVTNLDTNVRVTFNVHRWFARDEDDGAIDRVLTP